MMLVVDRKLFDWQSALWIKSPVGRTKAWTHTAPRLLLIFRPDS